MKSVPFTVRSDIDLGPSVAAYLCSEGAQADVSIAEGAVPDRLDGPRPQGSACQISGDRFLLHVPRGASYLVEGGNHITYSRNSAADRSVALFLLGSAWGALCYQRGLLPLHASAVIADGRIHAFTGQSGAGKSTLAAGLAAAGLQFFTDDVLIIDPARISKGKAICYAGQKSMKLWADALNLVTADKLGPVRDEPEFEKFFAAPAVSTDSMSGELASLFVLDASPAKHGEDPFAISPITGADSIKQLRASVYRLRFATAIWGLPKLYTVLAQLIAAVDVQSFQRPIDKHQFKAGLEVMIRRLNQGTKIG